MKTPTIAEKREQTFTNQQALELMSPAEMAMEASLHGKTVQETWKMGCTFPFKEMCVCGTKSSHSVFICC